MTSSLFVTKCHLQATRVWWYKLATEMVNLVKIIKAKKSIFLSRTMKIILPLCP